MGVTFEMGGIEEIQYCLQFGLVGCILKKQKDYSHSYKTDVVVAY